MLVALLLTSIAIILLVVEKLWIVRNIKKIPIRIHVNGTRGKSTVVKYISAILRSNNYKTVSKITGIIPTIYEHDNLPKVIKRKGGARVTEQFRIINRAASLDSDALVLECMTINPQLQIIESTAFQPQYYIITNIRKDHTEDMGQSEADWVDSICSAIPENCTVLTSEHLHFNKIKEYAELKNCRVVSTETIELEVGINPKLHIDNIKLALLYAKLEGLKTNDFCEYLKQVPLNNEDEIIFNYEGNKITFFNAFAINDVPSADRFLSSINENDWPTNKRLFIFNSRADRPYRSLQFAEWMAGINNYSKIILTGNHIHRTKTELLHLGVEKNKIVIWKNVQLEEVISNIKSVINDSYTFIGIGNIKHHGFQIIEAMKHLSKL